MVTVVRRHKNETRNRMAQHHNTTTPQHHGEKARGSLDQNSQTRYNGTMVQGSSYRKWPPSTQTSSPPPPWNQCNTTQCNWCKQRTAVPRQCCWPMQESKKHWIVLVVALWELPVKQNEKRNSTIFFYEYGFPTMITQSQSICVCIFWLVFTQYNPVQSQHGWSTTQFVPGRNGQHHQGKQHGDATAIKRTCLHDFIRSHLHPFRTRIGTLPVDVKTFQPRGCLLVQGGLGLFQGIKNRPGFQPGQIPLHCKIHFQHNGVEVHGAIV